MLSKPSIPRRAEISVPLPSRLTPRRNHGWVDLPCGKRYWFAQVPRRDEDFRNYIEIMDAFGRDMPETVGTLLFCGTDRVATQELSASSGPLNPENRITAMFSKDPENTWFDTHLVYIYYNGDIPGAKYDSHSDPSMCYHIAERMMDVIEKSGDEPLTVLPQASSWDLPPVQNPPSQTTSTSGDATHP